jgi:RNA polymerase sigma-70 factor (ECF subfamily)
MLDDQDIRRLILRTAAREVAGFEELYRRTAPLLLGVALRIARRRELAEDILHDSFVKIWAAAERYDPLAARPVAWLVAIVRNRAIDVVSAHDVARVDSLDASPDATPEETLDTVFDWSAPAEDGVDAARYRAWLRQCLAELQASERQAIVLAYDRGLSHGELAAHLNRPLGTVKAWIRRGLASLRACVERCGGSGEIVR